MNKTTKTFSPAKIERRWFVVDAEGMVLGRLATRIAHVLRGKHRVEYSPGVDVGEYVIVVNADKVAVTGNKMLQKKYYRHSTYRGNLKETTLSELMKKKPTEALRLAVKGMVPKNHLGKVYMKRLRVFVGAQHTHSAQSPVPLKVQD